jgi:hypothetical protein
VSPVRYELDFYIPGDGILILVGTAVKPSDLHGICVLQAINAIFTT